MLTTSCEDSCRPLGYGGTRPDVVFVYQRMLAYHRARFKAVRAALANEGKITVAVEVAPFDRSYGYYSEVTTSKTCNESGGEVISLFPATDYLTLKPRQVSSAVFSALKRLGPPVVFTPAPAFAEGAGALHYKVRCGCKLILMDDAWALTDRRSALVRKVKRWLYQYVDGGFFPSPLHGSYFGGLNVPEQRQRFAVDVVGDAGEESVPGESEAYCGQPYLMFIGRLIARKRLDVILRALSRMDTSAPRLVIIGDGPERESLTSLSESLGLRDRVLWLGQQPNRGVRRWLRRSTALLVPSEFEQWGLVVNEAWSAGVPVLGSEGVGSLRASVQSEMDWTLLPVGDHQRWVEALGRLLALTEVERTALINSGYESANNYSLAEHVKSALSLIDLPPRERPSWWIGALAQCWHGRVAVW